MAGSGRLIVKRLRQSELGFFEACRRAGRETGRQRALNIDSDVVRDVFGEPSGDVIEVTDKAKAQLRIKASSEAAESRGIPEWIEVDTKALKGKFKSLPARADMSSTINESLIIELYSK